MCGPPGAGAGNYFDHSSPQPFGIFKKIDYVFINVLGGIICRMNVIHGMSYIRE